MIFIAPGSCAFPHDFSIRVHRLDQLEFALGQCLMIFTAQMVSWVFTGLDDFAYPCGNTCINGPVFMGEG